jgi:hypothetical protein
MSFQASKNLGQLGEMLFHQAHNGDATKIDGLNGDFIWEPTGEKVELKSDFWKMEKTPNFFFERFSDRDRGTPGGPWRAQKDGSDLFVYFYVSDLTYFIFNTDELVGRLEKIIGRIEPTLVTNKSWITEGYRVPREMLKDIATEHKLVVRKDRKKKK